MNLVFERAEQEQYEDGREDFSREDPDGPGDDMAEEENEGSESRATRDEYSSREHRDRRLRVAHRPLTRALGVFGAPPRIFSQLTNAASAMPPTIAGHGAKRSSEPPTIIAAPINNLQVIGLLPHHDREHGHD